MFFSWALLNTNCDEIIKLLRSYIVTMLWLFLLTYKSFTESSHFSPYVYLQVNCNEVMEFIFITKFVGRVQLCTKYCTVYCLSRWRVLSKNAKQLNKQALSLALRPHQIIWHHRFLQQHTIHRTRI
jgi:hypothetical protein